MYLFTYFKLCEVGHPLILQRFDAQWIKSPSSLAKSGQASSQDLPKLPSFGRAKPPRAFLCKVLIEHNVIPSGGSRDLNPQGAEIVKCNRNISGPIVSELHQKEWVFLLETYLMDAMPPGS